jgi:hypothetical protein
MNKKIYFKKLVREYRKLLLSHRFLPSTLTMYAQGKICPSEKVAKRIARIIGVDLENFPYLKRNK